VVTKEKFSTEFALFDYNFIRQFFRERKFRKIASFTKAFIKLFSFPPALRAKLFSHKKKLFLN
jgi:hypothetical protein